MLHGTIELKGLTGFLLDLGIPKFGEEIQSDVVRFLKPVTDQCMYRSVAIVAQGLPDHCTGAETCLTSGGAGLDPGVASAEGTACLQSLEPRLFRSVCRTLLAWSYCQLCTAQP